MGVKLVENFEIDEEFAFKLDEEDPLSKYRERFCIPNDVIYMDGNSLGLCSKDAEKSIDSVLQEWKEKAIDGWMDADPPWFHFSEEIGAECADLVGAKEDEVILTGATTTNIHQLISTFYDPVGNKTKILADELTFPTDIYALKSQIKLRGLDPRENLVLAPGKNGILDEEKIVELMNDEVALAFLPSVLYRSGQLLDMKYLTEKAHEKNILIGFDCAHSVGAIPHKFDDWGVDFATWCGYKYLNGGPGSSAFIYINEKHFDKEPGLAGWWGYPKDEQFDMNLDFKSSEDAGGWHIGTPNILGSAALKGSLDIIKEAGIKEIRKKSLKLTEYLMYLIDNKLSEDPYNFNIGNPRNDNKRGGHVAIQRKKESYRINEALKDKGVIPDFRPPNVIRVAPIALYNTYHDVWKVTEYLKEIIDNKEYKEYSKQREGVS